MKLVIAEKPSVAQSLAAVLGATAKKNGYLEGNGWRISWCVGHLAGLAEAGSYDPRYVKWRREDLPILPEQWRMVIAKGKKKQFDVLKQLMNTPDVDSVVNACDAGREGELIFRSVYTLAGCQKPMERLWISSMEDSAIRDGFANLRPGAEYEGLYQAALCRTRADWLVGINATRLFSVLYRRTLQIGRVMSPTLALIVQRESDIAAFQPEPFYNTVLELPGFTASSERMKEKADAEQVAAVCSGATVLVKRVERRERTERPPALYDLTTLQRDANRQLGYTAQQTLDYLQSLYEKKLCTYPRTDSRYLTSDMAAGLPELVGIIGKVLGVSMEHIPCDPAQVVNDKKVSDHHAILPTKNIRNRDLSELPVGERAILELVSRRLLCGVGEAHRYAETAVTVQSGDHQFTAKGKTTLNPGWRAYLKQEDEKEQVLPDLTEGEKLSVSAVSVKKGQTTPPKKFTEDTLLAAMETAGAEEMPEDAERKGLGTPATRAAILEKLVSTGFVQRKKAKKAVHLVPSEDAAALMTILPEQLQSPLLTADWEYRLGEIERGERSAREFMDDISAMLRELVSNYQMVPGTEALFAPAHEVVGKCPRCGGEVAEMKEGFFCGNKSCKFAIWKNSRWWAMKKKQPTKAMVKALLKNGRVPVSGLFSEKTGKTYDAVVVLEDNGTYANFRLEFTDKRRK